MISIFFSNTNIPLLRHLNFVFNNKSFNFKVSDFIMNIITY